MSPDEARNVRLLLDMMVHLTYWYHRHWAHTMGITRCDETLCRSWRELMDRVDGMLPEREPLAIAACRQRGK